MSLITNEYNYQRKSHRVNLPLVVEIGAQQYAVLDWSLGGVGVRDFSPDSVADRNHIDAHVILPMPDSVLSLRVTLAFISQQGDKTGLEFVNLSIKHRRVLRHYIELSIEGKLENLEDLVAIVSSPQIASPIQEALNLSDLEDESLVRTFRQRSYLSILLAVVFLGGGLGIIFYNTMYRISTTGLISGTIRPISVGCSGTLKEVFVITGDRVEDGQELFTVEDNKRSLLTGKIQEDIQTVQEKIEFLQAIKLPDDKPLLSDLLEDYQENRRIYEEAKLLFEEGGITRKDLHLAKSYALRSKVSYERFLSSHKERSQRQRAEMQSLKRQRQRLEEELRGQSPDATVCVGVSPVAGKLFKIEKRSGDYVSANDIMGLLNTDTTPNVIIKLQSADALKISIGMAASIYARSMKTKYEARVAAIGYSAISGTTSLTMEASLNETLVRLDFVDPAVRFPVSSRVGVWIKTF